MFPISDRGGSSYLAYQRALDALRPILAAARADIVNDRESGMRFLSGVVGSVRPVGAAPAGR